MTPAPDLTVTTGDRSLNAWLSGDPAGRALVFHLGTPSPPVPWPTLDAACRQRNLRLVTYARPGYSGSTRQAGRTVADAARDVAAILDALDVGDFVTIGHSGGGPHALACAALLPDRCTAATSLAGVMPWEAMGEQWTAGMADENVEEFSAAQQGEDVLRPYLADELHAYADVTGDDIAEALGGLVTDVDRAALTGELAEVMAASLRRAAADGLDGWVDDDLAFLHPWGFDLDAIAVPVAVWQGRQDAMVPFTHGQRLAEAIPTARPQLHEDEGHVSLLTKRLGDILDGLLALPG